MSEKGRGIVYSRNVIEFVTVAREYCSFVEQVENNDKHAFIDHSSKILSLLYLKALLLPAIENVYDEELEKNVTEFDYQFVKKGIEQLLGDADQYLDFFDTDMKETPEPIASSISENMADVYQDAKDFLAIYQQGNENLMNDALHVCKQSFEEYWGFRVVNTLRILHYLLFNPSAFAGEETIEQDNQKDKKDTSSWFISRAQKDFGDDK